MFTSAMPALERACFFASWCSAGSYRAVTRWWLESAMSLAGEFRGDLEIPRARC
jgi:hypothetical protein